MAKFDDLYDAWRISAAGALLEDPDPRAFLAWLYENDEVVTSGVVRRVIRDFEGSHMKDLSEETLWAWAVGEGLVDERDDERDDDDDDDDDDEELYEDEDSDEDDEDSDEDDEDSDEDSDEDDEDSDEDEVLRA